MGYSWDIPSGKHTKSELENGPVEIVDLPSYKMVIFHSLLFVYRRVTMGYISETYGTKYRMNGKKQEIDGKHIVFTVFKWDNYGIDI